MRDIGTLEELLNTRTPVVAVESHEEAKVIGLLEKLANLNGRSLFVWNVTQGLRSSSNTDSIYNTQDLVAALRHIQASPADAVYVLVDAHPFLENPVVVRMVKNIALKADVVPRVLVFLSPALELPDELKRLAAHFSPGLPDRAAILRLLRQEADDWLGRNGERLRGEQSALEALVQHLVGLTEAEARRLIRLAIRDDGLLTAADIGKVLKAKHDFLGVGDVLALETAVSGMAEVGGLANLKRWLELRRGVFIAGGAGGALPPPKGILLLGVQGAGKSLAAKAVAGAWQLPLFRLDFGTLYNKFHGETERNLREVLKMAAAMSPCVLWMDEIEKGIAAGGSDSDGGVSQRVLGTLLTWMAERTERVFLVATANDIQRLPPELLRKGRFDEIFFVDLPDKAVRADILRIHLARRKQNPADFDLTHLAAASAGFSGAEIEQAILSGLYEAHAGNKPLDTAILSAEFARTRPLSVVCAEEIATLREWARERTVPAD